MILDPLLNKMNLEQPFQYGCPSIFSVLLVSRVISSFLEMYLSEGGGASGNLTVRGKMLATDQPLIAGGVVPSANPGDLEMTKNLSVAGTSTLGTKSTAAQPNDGLVTVESQLQIGEGAVVGTNDAGLTLIPNSIVHSDSLIIGSAPLADTTTVQFGGFNNAGAEGGTTELDIGDPTWTDMSVNMADFEADEINTIGRLQWSSQNPTITGGTGHFAGPANATIAANSSDQMMLLQLTATPGQINAGDTLTITFEFQIEDPIFYGPSPSTYGIFITPIVPDALLKPWAVIDQGAAPYQSFTITFPEINTATNPQYYIFVISTY